MTREDRQKRAGPLEFVRATTPTPHGPVSVDLRFADGTVGGCVTLPSGMSGAFVWKGRNAPLRSGVNELARDSVGF